MVGPEDQTNGAGGEAGFQATKDFGEGIGVGAHESQGQAGKKQSKTQQL